jgi:hypothetical protein
MKLEGKGREGKGLFEKQRQEANIDLLRGRNAYLRKVRTVRAAMVI